MPYQCKYGTIKFEDTVELQYLTKKKITLVPGLIDHCMFSGLKYLFVLTTEYESCINHLFMIQYLILLQYQ